MGNIIKSLVSIVLTLGIGSAVVAQDQVVRIAGELGREVATPEEAREILHLPQKGS